MIDARLTASKSVPRGQGFAHSLLTAAGTNCKSRFTRHAGDVLIIPSDKLKHVIVIVAFIIRTSVLLKLNWSYQLILDKLPQPPADNDFQLLLTLAIVTAVSYKK